MEKNGVFVIEKGIVPRLAGVGLWLYVSVCYSFTFVFLPFLSMHISFPL